MTDERTSGGFGPLGDPDEPAFAIKETHVTSLAYNLRLSGDRQRDRFRPARIYSGTYRETIEREIMDRMVASIDRWTRRHIRRRGFVPVSDVRIASGNAPYDTLFGDPDARRLRVSMRAIPADVAAEIAPAGRDIRVADDMYVLKYAVPK